MPPSRYVAPCFALLLSFVAADHARAQSSDAEPLVGSRWTLSTLPGVPGLQGRSPTIAFGPDGRVDGRGFCNNYRGTVRFDGAGRISSTRLFCSDIGREGALFAAIARATGYLREGATLSLLGAGGEELATFEALR